MRRLLAAVLLCLICFSLGVRAAPAMEAGPVPPSGEELWESLPPELLSDVAEGILERISGLQDDLRTVQQLQAERLAARPPPE